MALKVRVCRLADVDDIYGDRMRGFAVNGVTWPVMLARIVPEVPSESAPIHPGGELIAFPGVCPHDDVSLVDYGVIEDSDDGTRRELRCRVHGYAFDLATGRCEHAPLTLRRYRVTIIADDVWVDLL